MAWTRSSERGAEQPDDGARRFSSSKPPPRLERTARRILVVEDDQLLALQMQAILRSLGFEVLGPAGSLESGMRLAEAGDVDAAVLDVRLDQGQRVFPVAQTLQRRSIPFSFMTGYADPELERFHAPVLRKPVESGSVAAMIEQLIH